jgi:heme/copper-type cytochrome/quinol oxidase subunit 4
MKDGELEEKREERKGGRPSKWLLVFSFSVSITALIIYLVEVDFSDERLFFLLTVLRYSAFLVCICSFYKLLLNICRMIRRVAVHGVFSIFLYLALILYSLGIIFFEAFITAISRGNG